MKFCFCVSTDMKFLLKSYDQYEIPWSKDRRRDGLRDVNVSITTNLLPTQVQPTQLRYQFFYAISSWFSLLIRGNCYLPEQMTQIDSYSHSSYPTDVKNLQRNLKFYQRTWTDTKICQRILKFSQLKLKISQLTLKFCWQDWKWPKFLWARLNRNEIFYSRFNRKWKFVNKTQQTLKFVLQDLFKTQQKRNFVPKIQNDRNFQIQDWISDTGHHMDIQCMSLRHDFSVHCCSTETKSTKNWVLRREEDELYIFWSS